MMKFGQLFEQILKIPEKSKFDLNQLKIVTSLKDIQVHLNIRKIIKLRIISYNEYRDFGQLF